MAQVKSLVLTQVIESALGKIKGNLAIKEYHTHLDEVLTSGGTVIRIEQTSYFCQTVLTLNAVADRTMFDEESESLKVVE